jgi:hypothetical protein
VTAFVEIALPAVAGLELALRAPDVVVMKGTITVRDPSGDLEKFIADVHAHARAARLPAVKVDLTGLKFVNSSAIRVFVDWATTVKATPPPCYKLCVITDRRITWQRTSFAALVAMVGDILSVEETG